MITTALAILILQTTFTVKAESITNNEYQAVVNTAYKYFNGAAKGDQSLLGDSFDMDFGDVKMVIIDKDTQQETIRTVPFKKFATFFKKATKDTWHASILSVDIVDSKMAMVKMAFTTANSDYIDYLVMYKRDKQWRIINKTFVQNKK